MRQLKHGLLILALSFPLSTFASPQFFDSGLPSPKGVCAGASFGLVRQTISLDPPGPFVDGYIYADAFEDGPPLTQWADLFGSQFPSRQGDGVVLTIESGKFVALSFETGVRGDPIYAGSDFGIIRVFAAAASTGNLTMAFSECPGDFLNPVQANSFCRITTGQGAFSWQLAGTEPFVCQLAENTTYYFNVAHVAANGLGSCVNMPDGTCQTLLQPD